MKVLDRIFRATDFINDWLGKIVAISFGIFMTCIVTYDVIARYFFNNPSKFGFEMCCLMLMGTICLGAGYAILHKSHVRVDVIYGRLPEKTRAILDVTITTPLLLVVCAVLIWYGGIAFWEALIHNTKSNSIWVYPMWPVYLMIPIAGLLMAVAGLARWMHSWFVLVKGERIGK